MAMKFFGFFVLASYLMAIIRWFLVDHYSFWHGFKELVWVLVPVINAFYVWEWWATIILLPFVLLSG